MAVVALGSRKDFALVSDGANAGKPHTEGVAAYKTDGVNDLSRDHLAEARQPELHAARATRAQEKEAAHLQRPARPRMGSTPTEGKSTQARSSLGATNLFWKKWQKGRQF